MKRQFDVSSSIRSLRHSAGILITRGDLARSIRTLFMRMLSGSVNQRGHRITRFGSGAGGYSLLRQKSRRSIWKRVPNRHFRFGGTGIRHSWRYQFLFCL